VLIEPDISYANDNGHNLGLYVRGERVIISHQGYVEIYSLATGRKEGEIFGWPRSYCKAANLMSVGGENQNELAIYDLSSRSKLDEFTFASNVDLDQFSEDGKRLFVLTNDQTAFSLDISNLVRPSGAEP